MASNVTPSLPGAPSFFLAIAYAACSVSILQTWTYSPQNRQDGSAFALTYILRLRSCKLMGAFVISPLPSMLSEELQHSRAPSLRGRYPASSLLRTRPTPSRLRPISRVPGYTAYLAPPISRRDEEGFSSCLARPCHRAVATTPPEWVQPHQSVSADPCCLRPSLRARPPGLALSRPPLRSLALRPGDSPPSLRMALSIGFRILGFPPHLLSKLRGF